MSVHESFERLLEDEARYRASAEQLDAERRKRTRQLLEHVPLEVPIDRQGLVEDRHEHITHTRLHEVFIEHADRMTVFRYQTASQQAFAKTIYTNSTGAKHDVISSLQDPTVQQDLKDMETLMYGFRREVIIKHMTLLAHANKSHTTQNSEYANAHAFMLVNETDEGLRYLSEHGNLDDSAIVQHVAEAVLQFRLFQHDTLWHEILFKTLQPYAHEGHFLEAYDDLDSLYPQTITRVASILNTVWDLPDVLRPDVQYLQQHLNREVLISTLKDAGPYVFDQGDVRKFDVLLRQTKIAHLIASRFRYEASSRNLSLFAHAERLPARLHGLMEHVLHGMEIYVPEHKQMVLNKLDETIRPR